MDNIRNLNELMTMVQSLQATANGIAADSPRLAVTQSSVGDHEDAKPAAVVGFRFGSPADGQPANVLSYIMLQDQLRQTQTRTQDLLFAEAWSRLPPTPGSKAGSGTGTSAATSSLPPDFISMLGTLNMGLQTQAQTQMPSHRDAKPTTHKPMQAQAQLPPHLQAHLQAGLGQHSPSATTIGGSAGNALSQHLAMAILQGQASKEELLKLLQMLDHVQESNPSSLQLQAQSQVQPQARVQAPHEASPLLASLTQNKLHNFPANASFNTAQKTDLASLLQHLGLMPPPVAATPTIPIVSDTTNQLLNALLLHNAITAATPPFAPQGPIDSEANHLTALCQQLGILHQAPAAGAVTSAADTNKELISSLLLPKVVTNDAGTLDTRYVMVEATLKAMFPTLNVSSDSPSTTANPTVADSIPIVASTQPTWEQPPPPTMAPLKRGRAVKFPKTLHAILVHLGQDGRGIAEFTPDGMSFVIRKPEGFAKEILPEHFKMSTFSSFQRQINLYDFQRVKGEQDISYKHPLFQRDNPELCVTMRRTKRKKRHLDYLPST